MPISGRSRLEKCAGNNLKSIIFLIWSAFIYLQLIISAFTTAQTAAWTNMGCFWPIEGFGDYTCGGAPGVNTAETGYCIFGSETAARIQCEVDPLCYGYAAGSNGGNYQLTKTVPTTNIFQGACSFFVKPMAGCWYSMPGANINGSTLSSVAGVSLTVCQSNCLAVTGCVSVSWDSSSSSCYYKSRTTGIITSTATDTLSLYGTCPSGAYFFQFEDGSYPTGNFAGACSSTLSQGNCIVPFPQILDYCATTPGCTSFGAALHAAGWMSSFGSFSPGDGVVGNSDWASFVLTACPNGCSACTDSFTCTSCLSGYSLYSGLCTPTAQPTQQPTSKRIGMLYTSVTASNGLLYFNTQSVGMLEDQNLDDYWNPHYASAHYDTPDHAWEYDVTFTFASPQSLSYVEFYPITDGVHTPTGYNIYTDSSMSTLLASNLAPNKSSNLITLPLTVPTVLSSVYVQILKSNYYQIWLHEVQFYVLGKQRKIQVFNGVIPVRV